MQKDSSAAKKEKKQDLIVDPHATYPSGLELEFELEEEDGIEFEFEAEFDFDLEEN